ncbi:zinc ribbon domain-containing protein [Streptococcus orisratti]|uniref:zinc ribbon domain-containing protein n=1 Tax=Streptococcus orisratti TaxID=114652 RepID=UPI003D092AF0
MNQKEWVEAFKKINGRNPSPSEFSEALKKKEFSIEQESTVDDCIPKTSAEIITAKEKESATQVENIKNHYQGDLKNLKRQIKAENQELTKAFIKLGLSYYNYQLNHSEFNSQELVGNIVTLNKNLYALKRTYNKQSPNNKTCLSCGSSLKKDDRFCSICGSDVQELELKVKNEVKICDVCEAEQALKNKFCACCGKEFGGDTDE